MVRSLVEMHGGTVTAHSDGPGKGSEFLVRLPALPAGAPETATAPGAAVGPRRVCRLLVVDDNRDAADSLALLLRLGGHTVQVAYDGCTALQAAKGAPPEVVLLDIGLPGMDGYEVARRLRAQEATRGVVLIAISGYGQEDDRSRSRAAGFDHHLVKPVEPLEVEALLAQWAGSITRSELT
jgi:two-component system CheB/CheR fusion protein